ncbi:hypothetical protein EDC56_2274 [Sinobacterium caligoides]|uniref:KANL3/Tex30 alpha/beta hydrolase-like domain-containing protein n=1 Tax=Sinobacterium caligoides TaxID=933926 RepID=A0A3N2DPU2_9GAMM|nr:alpha/beta fold hydrolase [Sinobacterium caligoides]ROS01826.1 hypothetical protein EDC56_2274 [Sinobacterium caligoides]
MTKTPLPPPDITKNLRFDGPNDADTTLILAHGAGAGMDHEFMQQVAAGIASHGIQVIRFEFPYMAKRRLDGRKYPPDRAPKAMLAFQQLINHVQQHYSSRRLFIGGKSMGGRLASLLAAEYKPNRGVDGVICLGFPFCAPGKPEVNRGEHLAEIRLPTLIIQGERDSFGGREAIESFPFSAQVSAQLLPDGDHSFKPRVKSGHTLDTNIEQAIASVAAFCLHSPADLSDMA